MNVLDSKKTAWQLGEYPAGATFAMRQRLVSQSLLQHPCRLFISLGAAVLGATLFFSSEARSAGDSLTVLETAGRFSELQKQIENRLDSGEKPTVTLIGPLCVAHQNLKQYAKLFECLTKLEQLIQDGDTKIKADYVFVSPADSRPLPDTLRAEALLELGRYEEAIATGLRALEAIPQGSAVDMSIWPPLKYRLTILPILAIASVHAKHVERAKQFVDQLEATSIPFVGGSLLSPVKENGLARAYMAVGEYAKALDMLGGSGLRNIAVTLTDLTTPFVYRGDSIAALTELRRLVTRSKALIETAQLKEARDILDQLLVLPRLKDVGDLYWIALFERGRIADAEKETGKAAELYRQAVELVELQRSSINTEASKIGFVGDKQQLYARLVAVLIEQGQIVEAFEYVERAKARALVDMLATKQDFTVHTANASAVRTLLAKADTAEVESRVQGESADTKGTRSLVVQTRQQLHQQAPELSSLVSVSP